MGSVYIYNEFGELVSYGFWLHLSELIEWVCQNWQRPDEGICEVRGGRRSFLYSCVMCWVAVDSFTMCSFWNVECLARAGDLKQGRFFFEMTLGYARYLGLYAEEIGLHGERLGNFPQAFRHLGLISAAYYLDQAIDQQGQQT